MPEEVKEQPPHPEHTSARQRLRSLRVSARLILPASLSERAFPFAHVTNEATES